MRLLIIGTLGGQLTTATKLAMEKGANVTHADSNDQAPAVLRSGRGADLLMVDVALDIRDLDEVSSDHPVIVRHRGGQEIVSLVPRSLGVREAAGGDEHR